MTKTFLSFLTCAVVALTYKPILADAPDLPVEPESKNTISESGDFNTYALEQYRQIDFKGKERLNADVFKKAFTGYLNLKAAKKMGGNAHILTICDFSLSSNKKRLWILDMNTKKVLINDLVAHGSGSGEEMAASFSNTEDSHQSSLGFYVTGDTYIGEHGTSLRLHGMDRGYNDAALTRGIVVHGADYVNTAYAAANKRIGRSWGCPAVNQAISQKVINYIKSGSCLFIYANDRGYHKKAYWVNKKVENIPAMAGFCSPEAVLVKGEKLASLTPVPKKPDTVFINVPAPTQPQPVSLF